MLAAASSLRADEYLSMSPTSGPTTGGTVVTIKGNFAEWEHGVIFGSIPATSTTRVDAHTLVAVAPPHLPGAASISVFEYDLVAGTPLVFTFEGDVPASIERMLLPLFTPPVKGAFGSEFHTDFTARLTKRDGLVRISGLVSQCLYCYDSPSDQVIRLFAYRREVQPAEVIASGNPGRFIYLDQADVEKVAMNLRVYDVSRDAQNFGTEMPIVRGRSASP